MDTCILVDVDGVLADLVGAICGRIGGGYEPSDFTRYEFASVLPAQYLAKALGAMQDPGFVLGLPEYAGAREFISSLKKLGHLVAVTKPYDDGPTWTYERARWLWSRGIGRVVHTGEKLLVRGGVLIEDNALNIASWLKVNPSGFAVLMDRPWNRDAFYSARACLVHDYVQGRVKRAVSYPHALEILESK